MMTSTIAEEQLAIDALTAENTSLLSFLYACPIGLLDISSNGDIGMMTPLAMQLMMQMHPAPSVNFFDAMVVHGPELRNLVTSFTGTHGTVCAGHRILIRNSHVKQADLRVFSCTIVKLSQERFMVAIEDVSNQVNQERKLKEAETWFSSLLDGASDFGVASLDASGHIASVSSAISRQTGFEQQELLGQDLNFFNLDDLTKQRFDVEEQLSLATREGWHLHEDWHRHKNGSKVWFQRLVAVRNETTDPSSGAESGYTVIFREGQQRSIDNNKLKQMLLRDHLTGTYNRMHFFELAERETTRAKRYGKPLSLLVLDIDLFKCVNDTFGHSVGDDVLRQVSQCCMSLLRSSDTMARVGGEEFSILLPETDLSGAVLMAERLRVAVEGLRIETETRVLKVTGSFGCAEMSEDYNIAATIKAADQALYSAKEQGRNRVVAHEVTVQ